MKKNVLLLLIIILLVVYACSKESKSQSFLLLTGPVWTSDTLLVNGADASGPGGMLRKFMGDIKFREDGTGYFGQYLGKWRFAFGEKELIIESDSLMLPISANISELTKQSLKLTTNYPNPINLTDPFRLRMTFKAK
jgi:hypothetical protein